jgi:hypothetical protein
MSTRTHYQVVEDFLASYRQMLSCITSSVLLTGRSANRIPFAFLGRHQPVPLRSPNRLSLSLLFGYEVVKQPGIRDMRVAVRITDYMYQINLADGRELLAFQWHPDGQSWMREAHLHLGDSLRGINLSKAHVPTGHVTLQSVLRFLIFDLRVDPIRTDWRDILDVPADAPAR